MHVVMIKKRIATIRKRIDKIKSELEMIGDMRPGLLTKQYRDPENRTGAYYQISYTHEMKSCTEYVRSEFVKENRLQVKNYKRYKKLNSELISLSIEHSKLAMKLKRDNC